MCWLDDRGGGYIYLQSLPTPMGTSALHEGRGRGEEGGLFN